VVSAAAGRKGRGWARTSLILGLAGVGVWVLIRLLGANGILSHVPNWAFIAVFLVGGPIGIVSGVIGVFRGGGRVRLMAIVGLVLSLAVTLVGLAVLALSQANVQFFPPGAFA